MLDKDQDAVDGVRRFVRHVGKGIRTCYVRGQPKCRVAFYSSRARLLDFLVLAPPPHVELGKLLSLLLELLVAAAAHFAWSARSQASCWDCFSKTIRLCMVARCVEHDADAVGELLEEGSFARSLKELT